MTRPKLSVILLLLVWLIDPVISHSAEPAFRFRETLQESGLAPLVEGIQGHGAAWGDVDGDGWLDLYVGTFHTEGPANRLLLNREKKFQLHEQEELRISTRATGIVFADLDNDGDLDLYVASMPADENSRLAQKTGKPLAGCSLFRNEGKGKFTNVSQQNGACPAAFGGRSVAVLDYNGDGLLDLLVGEDPLPGYNGSATKSSRLFRNLGKLQFEDVSRAVGLPPEISGLGVAAADVNNDGWPDLFLASSTGNHLFLNDGKGKFQEAPGSGETFAWPESGGDDMVCGIAFGDVNRDGLQDLVLGHHFQRPWLEPVANRLYLNRGIQNGVPRFENVTEQVGLVPLPMKAPHVEIQDFDNDGWPDIFSSLVTFEGTQPHPLIFQHQGLKNGLPRFETETLIVNDFPTEEDRALKRSGEFFEKMIRERKILYMAAAPSGDYDNDGRLDLFLANWWTNSSSLLLHNETPGGNWLDVQVQGNGGVNRQGIGSVIRIYPAGKLGDPASLLGCREISVGYGYASGQAAVAHFGLGKVQEVDLEVVLPHGQGTIQRRNVKANQRVTLSSQN